MNARLFRAKHEGQSIVVIALIIVVLFGMVALSVDVGNTYAENRSAVRSTNAAALAGMDKLINGGSDQTIAAVIKASFKSNGITAQLDPTVALGPGERRIYAYYLDAAGNPLPSGVSCTIGKCGGVPPNVAYLQIRTEGTVDTYFARVVGRDTLPVKAQAFAAQCTPVKGTYPIALNAADFDFDNGKFLAPTDPTEKPFYGTYTDSQYPLGLSERRIYRKPNFGSPGSFSWLQWESSAKSGSAVSTAAMLTGDGNLDLGFDEVTPWPDGGSTAPNGYPLLPHQLSDGDWIYGNTGSTNSNADRAAMDFHVAKHTIMNLPIIDKVVGSGQNTSFHVLKMGAFFVRSYDLSGQNGGYFDLVYIGDAHKVACLNTNVSQGVQGLGLVGQVFLNPRWLQEQAPHQPIAYQIVLDVSGSMSWDFNGYGTYGGKDVQCESPKNPNPLNLTYTDQCAGGPNSAWKTQSQRRVYVAKNAIKNFINAMGPLDKMRVIAYTGGSNNRASLAVSSAWTSDKATLTSFVDSAGSYNSNPYLTSGGTPGADGMDKASKLFLASNGYVGTEPTTGQDYKPAVIYLTDGVANIFLGGGVNDARDICSNLTAAEARNTASPCQIGQMSNGTLRPISAVIDVANKMKASINGLEVYVVALAQAPATGLPMVANDSSYFFTANQGFQVQQVLDKIQAKVTGATCTAAGGYQWINTIDGSHTPSPAPGAGIYGYVDIYVPGSATPKYHLPIQHDTSVAADGRLGFSIAPPDPNNPSSTGVTPGTYEVTAYVLYKGDDNKTRQYDYFINQSTLSGAGRTTISVSSAATLGSSVALAPFFLDLSPDKYVCATNP